VFLTDRSPCRGERTTTAEAPTPSQPVEVVEATFNTYAVRAQVAVPSLLVYSDTYYEGWRAFVDGGEVPIARANHAFKAVRVDPGEHLVRFVFDPLSFRIGAAVSGLGLVFVVGLLCWSVWRSTRARMRTSDRAA